MKSGKDNKRKDKLEVEGKERKWNGTLPNEKWVSAASSK